MDIRRICMRVGQTLSLALMGWALWNFVKLSPKVITWEHHPWTGVERPTKITLLSWGLHIHWKPLGVSREYLVALIVAGFNCRTSLICHYYWLLHIFISSPFPWVTIARPGGCSVAKAFCCWVRSCRFDSQPLWLNFDGVEMQRRSYA